MTKAEIAEKIAQGEDSRTQFKRGPVGVAKLSAEFAAFSNAFGGVIIFGVDDDGKVVGLNPEDKKRLADEIANAANDCVRPSVYPKTEYLTIRGKQILCATITEGVSKPYTDKSGNYWTKSGADKRRITSREELQRIFQKSHLLYADEVPVYGTSSKDIDLYHFGEFLELNNGISIEDVLEPGKVDIPQILRNLGFERDGQLTLAGLLLFGKNPQRYAPMNVVKCVAFVGNDVAGTQYRDSEDYRGTIRDMYKSTMQFILRNLRHEQSGQGFNSTGIAEIPEVALQELVVNMFLHRDYFMASPWRVMVFDDRVEIISPGALPNHLTVEMMKSGASVARNPLIFSFATKEIPYRGIGSGIKRVMELAKRVELVSDSETNYFTAIIHRETPAPIKSGVAPINSGVAPINSGVAPIKSDTAPINSASAPINSASAPINSGVAPIKSGVAPIKSDTAPIKSESAPINSATAPINSGVAPINSASAPINSGVAPINSASAPIKSEGAPINSTEAADRIFEIVRDNPGINKAEISHLTGVAVWTVKRLLADALRGKVEFRGAKKTGGYHILEITNRTNRKQITSEQIKADKTRNSKQKKISKQPKREVQNKQREQK